MRKPHGSDAVRLFYVKKHGKMLKICRIMLDIIEQMLYNIITGKGCRVQKERRTKPRKGGKAVDAEQMKKLLELLEQALKCEQVATITITIKPNQKPKQ